MSIINFLAARISIKRVRSVFPALPLLYFMARAYFISAETNAMYTERGKMQEKNFSVASIPENKPPADYMPIIFYESIRINNLFKLPSDYATHPGFLEEAKEKKLFVHITPISAYSNKIMNGQ
jgi:hypothetical protein